MNAETPGHWVSEAIRETGMPAAIKLATELLEKLAGPAAGELGLWGQDKVRELRARNQLATFGRVREQLSAAGIEPGVIPLRTLAPLLEGASWEEDPSLREMWAALIANAASGTVDVPPALPVIMSQLSPQDARLLHDLFTVEGWPFEAGTTRGQPREHHGPMEPEEVRRRNWMVDVSASNLLRAGLVSLALPSGYVKALAAEAAAENDGGYVWRTRPPKSIEHDLVLTALGEAFLLASLPPRVRPVRTDTDGIEGDYQALRRCLRILDLALRGAIQRGDADIAEEILVDSKRIKLLASVARAASSEVGPR